VSIIKLNYFPRPVHRGRAGADRGWHSI